MKHAVASILALLLLASQTAAVAQPVPAAGRDYIVLEPPRPPGAGGRIEVIEFFYYGCPVCYESQPHIAHWRAEAGPDVLHLRVPSATSEDAESFARTYYALEAIGEVDRLHAAVYENHHFDDERLGDEKKLLEWLARNGVEAEAFRRLRDSPDTQARVVSGRKVYESYNVRAVPTFVVDGKYLTSARLAGGTREMMQVVAFLVERARAERSRR